MQNCSIKKYIFIVCDHKTIVNKLRNTRQIESNLNSFRFLRFSSFFEDFGPSQLNKAIQANLAWILYK